MDRHCFFILFVFFLYFSRKLTFFSRRVHSFFFSFSLFDGVFIFCSLSLLSSLSLSELLGDLLNGAVSTPVSTTTVVLRDLIFREWRDEMDGGGGGGGSQSVLITAPLRYISLNAGAVAAQRNSGIAGR